MSRLTVYSKAACPLCDEGMEKVERLARRFGLGVAKVDIESDPILVERHGRRIPVVELDGRELGWGRLSEKALARRLEQLLSPP